MPVAIRDALIDIYTHIKKEYNGVTLYLSGYHTQLKTKRIRVQSQVQTDT